MIEALYDPNDRSIDVDGKLDHGGLIQYIGKATQRLDGMWVCRAIVGGALCLVEVRASPLVIVDRDPGDEQKS